MPSDTSPDAPPGQRVMARPDPMAGSETIPARLDEAPKSTGRSLDPPVALTPGSTYAPRDRPLLPRDLLALQRSTGNAAVAQLMRRRPVPVQKAPPPGAPVATAGDRGTIDKALKSPEPDSSLVKDIDDFGPATGPERIKLAEILVYHYSAFFGPRDRSCLTRIFSSFGGNLNYVADNKPFLLEKCLKEWPGLMFDLKPVKEAGNGFKQEIGSEARKNLESNISYLKNEKKRLFGVEGAAPEAMLADSKQQQERAKAMVLIAEKILKLRRNQKAMLDKVVGFKYQDHNPVAPTAPQTFSPGKPPQHRQEQEPTYESLNESWDAAAMLTGLHATKYPWLFGLLKDPESADARLQGLVAQKENPTAARVQIMAEMQTQITRAEAILTGYQTKEPDWYDLVPVREQLFEKALNKNFERLVARQVVEGRDDAEWFKKVGLESITMAALVVASFATAGAAPVIAGVIAGAVAVGVPAAQAYEAYAKAGELQDASKATVLPGTDLVTESQVDAAKAEALSKVIETLLNATMLGGEAVVAAKFEIQLARLGEYGAGRQAELIAQAVTKGYGPVGTSTRTGLSLAQLVAKVGPETEAGKLIQKEIAELALKPVAELTVEQRGAIRVLAKDVEGGAAEGAERTLSDPKVAAALTGEAQELIRTWTQLETTEARLAWCKQRTVALLKNAGIDVEIAVVGEDMSPGIWGSFSGTDWKIRLNRTVLADHNASAATISEMMKTVLHESRHAEQYWLMARRLYGKGWQAPQIEEALKLRLEVIGSARRAGGIVDSDTAAQAIDFWLKDFETQKARDFRDFFLTQKSEWKKKLVRAEREYYAASRPGQLQPVGRRDALLKTEQYARQQFQIYYDFYAKSGVEADAFQVERGVAVDLAQAEQAKAIYDTIFKEWTDLLAKWEARLFDRETELELVKKANKPATIIKMREADVAEAKQLLADVKSAKPDVR